MPMSEDFKKRLNSVLSEIIEHFGTPFHILDEQGIRETCIEIADAFHNVQGYRNFFAVKACPRFEILKILQEMGMGFDCSSPYELRMVREIGAKPEDIFFTSNNTTREEYNEALSHGGCILNLDDKSFLDKVPRVPKTFCFRYNPGDRRTGTNQIIGDPLDQKYGVPHEQIVEAYRKAKKKGITEFWIHAMIASGTLDETYIVQTVQMLIEIVYLLKQILNIKVNINIGGGVGIPYYVKEKKFDMQFLSIRISLLLQQFYREFGYIPRIVSEMGRYVTGPHGVLVTRCVNKMQKYKTFIGVDACMSANPRSAIYSTPEKECYHHITIVDEECRGTERVNVVGSLCENNDQFARDRMLPVIYEGDPLFIHDIGAHALAMGGPYNARLALQELLFCIDGSVKCMKEAETYEDYVRTQRRAMANPRTLTF